jgi:hypothetical protein
VDAGESYTIYLIFFVHDCKGWTRDELLTFRMFENRVLRGIIGPKR